MLGTRFSEILCKERERREWDLQERKKERHTCQRMEVKLQLNCINFNLTFFYPFYAEG
jgi:hypothetical protein